MAKVICIDDTQNEHYGFLLLKVRKIKDPRITKGKVYDVIQAETTIYGKGPFAPEFTSYLIIDDRGIRQIFTEEQVSLIY